MASNSAVRSRMVAAGSRNMRPMNVRYSRAGEVLEQAQVLRHHTHAPLDLARLLQVAQVLAQQEHRPGGWRQQPGQHLDRRGLARAIGAQETVKRPLLDLEVDGIHRAQTAKATRQTDCFDGQTHLVGVIGTKLVWRPRNSHTFVALHPADQGRVSRGAGAEKFTLSQRPDAVKSARVVWPFGVSEIESAVAERIRAQRIPRRIREVGARFNHHGGICCPGDDETEAIGMNSKAWLLGEYQRVWQRPECSRKSSKGRTPANSPESFGGRVGFVPKLAIFAPFWLISLCDTEATLIEHRHYSVPALLLTVLLTVKIREPK